MRRRRKRKRVRATWSRPSRWWRAADRKRFKYLTRQDKKTSLSVFFYSFSLVQCQFRMNVGSEGPEELHKD